MTEFQLIDIRLLEALCFLWSINILNENVHALQFEQIFHPVWMFYLLVKENIS